MWLAITNSFLLIGIFQTLLGPIFRLCWAQAIPFFTYFGPMFGLCWAKFRLWKPHVAHFPPHLHNPRSWTPPAHKTVQYLAKFLALFLCFSMFFHNFLVFHNITIFSLPASKSLPPDPKLGARPSKHAQNRLKMGQRRPRWATHTAYYAPNLPKDPWKHFNTYLPKTGNPIQKLNSNADNTKEPHNNISRNINFSCVFPRFSRYLQTS